MLTIGQPAEQLGVTLEHGAHPRQVAAVADHDQVVIVIRIGVLAEALDLRHEGIHLRHRIAAQWRRAAAQLLHRQGHRQRRAERVRLRVLVADAEDVASSPDALDDLGRHAGDVVRQSAR